MKKIIALFVFFFAFSINAAAQDNKAEIDRNAKKDLEALIGIVKLDSNTETAIYRLFVKKHEGMLSPNATDASKRDISSVIEAKLRATLTAEQTALLEKNRTVLTQLVSAAPVISEKK